MREGGDDLRERLGQRVLCRSDPGEAGAVGMIGRQAGSTGGCWVLGGFSVIRGTRKVCAQA